MLDKFIALDEDKCHFLYQLINAMGATNVVEAGTSFGVSTIYLALATAQTRAATGKKAQLLPQKRSQQRPRLRRAIGRNAVWKSTLISGSAIYSRRSRMVIPRSIYSCLIVSSPLRSS